MNDNKFSPESNLAILAARLRAMKTGHPQNVTVRMLPAGQPLPMLLTWAQVAEQLGTSVPTARGLGLPVVHLGPRLVRVKRTDVEAFVDAHRYEPPEESCPHE